MKYGAARSSTLPTPPPSSEACPPMQIHSLLNGPETELTRPATHAELESYARKLLRQAAADPAKLEVIYTTEIYTLAGTLKLLDHRLMPTQKQRALVDNAYRKCASECEKLDPIDAPPPPPDASTSVEGHPGASFETLTEFYSSFDKLERLSPMGARFLEAYAEKLREDVCKDCWFEHKVLSDQELEDEDVVNARPAWQGSGERVVHPYALE